ncbi:MAG: hypothetical protein Q9225_001139 [Loekoesia sp. 1 TL-2023]
MACLWAAHAGPAMGVDGDWQRSVASGKKTCIAFGGFIVRHLDVPGPYFFQLESIFSTLLGCAWVTGGLWHLQSHHLSRLSPPLRNLPPSSFLSEVRVLFSNENPSTYIVRPFSLLALCSTFLLTTSLAIAVDTSFYHPSNESLFQLLRTNPTITPLNFLLYNTSASNLSLHGLHPPYQHFIASLPLLLGPALLLLWYIRKPTLPILSVLSATVLLSLIPHQEPRFLLPAVPLVLASVRLPKSAALRRYWLGSWFIFNVALGILMGVYHQGGVIPAQLWLGQQQQHDLGFKEVFWWRTYSPPIWLLGGKEILTTDLMGMKTEKIIERVSGVIRGCGEKGDKSVGLVAPLSSVELDTWMEDARAQLSFEQLWLFKNHLNLDDLDFEEDGIRGTLERVVGRRGLVVWKVSRLCEDS